ncbi:MAG: hypothetical protein IJY96_04280 [Oscillospiraceae bacterium]|nr:hypothetical protein [Oscillospiraceae bacterium]
MDNEQLAIKLQETTDRSLRNEGRIKKLEGESETLRDLATSVAVMAEQLKQITSAVGNLNTKVDVIEARPAKKWEAVTAAAITAIVAALVGFVLGRLGL